MNDERHILVPGFPARSPTVRPIAIAVGGEVGGIGPHAGQSTAWESPFYTTTYVDGTAFRDGNPIFSAADPVRRLGVRVIQFEPTGDTGEMASWLNTFAKGEPGEVEELVISCSLTDATLSKACDLIRQWITKGHVDGELGAAWNQSFSSDLTPADRPA